MRNAALVLGLIGGLFGLLVGFVGYGYTEAIEVYGEVEGLFEQVTNVQAVRLAGLLSPILAIAGAGMAKVRALWGGVLLLAGALGFYLGFGVTVFTIFPIAFIGIAALLALAAGKPDEPQAHF
ncbi:hypothetical protein [Pseudooceanicola marinus]|uniref:hypothetical protein n=1 Tax=Pseudooceanicola marinus TaxID=396013 RepID=UPI001C96F53F|nr:hypothetical protein [Pseudooceanicola marinus]MBY5972779.1 hypothetical protein [Ferrimonas balearica]MCA1336635.1 hypothetical protein [Pseudooceanicola marinus]